MRNTHFVFRRPFGVEIRLAEDRLADMDVVLRVLVQAFVVGILKEMSVREMESRPVADRVSHPEAGAPLRLRFRRNNDRAVKRVAPERRPLIGVIETEADADDQRAQFDLVLQIGGSLDRMLVEDRDVRRYPLRIIHVEVVEVMLLQVDSRAHFIAVADLPGQIPPGIERLRPIVRHFHGIRQGIELGPQADVAEILPVSRREVLRCVLVDPRIVRLVEIRKAQVVEEIREDGVRQGKERVSALFPYTKILVADVFPALVVRLVVVLAVSLRQRGLQAWEEIRLDFCDDGKGPVIAKGEPGAPCVPFGAAEECQIFARNRAAQRRRDAVLPVRIVGVDAEFARPPFKLSCKVLPAFLGDDVDHAAERVSVLCVEGTVKKHKFRDRVVMDPRAGGTEDRILDVHTVDQVGDFVRPAAADVEIPPISDNAGLHLQDFDKILHGHHLDLFAADDGRCRSRVPLHHRAFGLDNDLGDAHGGGLHGHVDGCCLIGHDPHVLHEHRSVSHEHCAQAVHAGRNVQDEILPLHIGRSAERRSDKNGVASHQRFTVRLVGDAAGDLSCRSSENGAEPEQDASTKAKGWFHGDSFILRSSIRFPAAISRFPSGSSSPSPCCEVRLPS